MPDSPRCDHFFPNTSLRKLSLITHLEQHTGERALLVPSAIVSACVLICKPAEQKTNLGLEVVLLSFFCPLGGMGSTNAAHHCLSPQVPTDGFRSVQNSGLFQGSCIYTAILRGRNPATVFWGKIGAKHWIHALCTATPNSTMWIQGTWTDIPGRASPDPRTPFSSPLPKAALVFT